MMWTQAMRFGIVGMLATFVHMVIGSLLIAAGWLPAVANLFAFVTAFSVSFIGHLGYSFAGSDIAPSRALRKFSVVALLGFACNEALLITLTSIEFLSATYALWVSTGFAAVVTFALSRAWAFRPPEICHKSTSTRSDSF